MYILGGYCVRRCIDGAGYVGLMSWVRRKGNVLILSDGDVV